MLKKIHNYQYFIEIIKKINCLIQCLYFMRETAQKKDISLVILVGLLDWAGHDLD